MIGTALKGVTPGPSDVCVSYGEYIVEQVIIVWSSKYVSSICSNLLSALFLYSITIYPFLTH